MQCTLDEFCDLIHECWDQKPPWKRAMQGWKRRFVQDGYYYPSRAHRYEDSQVRSAMYRVAGERTGLQPPSADALRKALMEAYGHGKAKERGGADATPRNCPYCEGSGILTFTARVARNDREQWEVDLSSIRHWLDPAAQDKTEGWYEHVVPCNCGPLKNDPPWQADIRAQVQAAYREFDERFYSAVAVDEPAEPKPEAPVECEFDEDIPFT